MVQEALKVIQETEVDTDNDLLFNAICSNHSHIARRSKRSCTRNGKYEEKDLYLVTQELKKENVRYHKPDSRTTRRPD